PTRHHHMHAEESVGIQPEIRRRPARLRREGPESLGRELVRILGVDGLARPEVEIPAEDLHALRMQADEMHLDPALRRVPARIMHETREVEIPSQLAVDPREQIEVEL